VTHLRDDRRRHSIEVIVLQVEAGELAVAAEHRPEGEAALGSRAVPSQIESLQAAMGTGLQREGEHLDPGRSEEVPAQVEVGQGRLGEGGRQRRGEAHAQVVVLEVQRAQRWRVAGYHPLAPVGIGDPDEIAQRVAHGPVVAEQVTSHLKGAQSASHAALVRDRSQHLRPRRGADLVVGEIELRQARVALERRGEQLAALHRSKRGRSERGRRK